MTLVLALQDGLEAVRLVTGDEPVSGPRDGVRLLLWGAIGVGVVLASVVLVGLARKAAVRRDPAEFAFRSLSRKMGLSASEKRLVRNAGTCVEAAPVALLVSEEACRVAFSRMDRAVMNEKDLQSMRTIMRKLNINQHA